MQDDNTPNTNPAPEAVAPAAPPAEAAAPAPTEEAPPAAEAAPAAEPAPAEPEPAAESTGVVASAKVSPLDPEPDAAPAEQSPLAETAEETPATESSDETETADKPAAADAAPVAAQSNSKFVTIIIIIFSVLSVASIVMLIVYVIIPLTTPLTTQNYQDAYTSVNSANEVCNTFDKDKDFLESRKETFENCKKEFKALRFTPVFERDSEAKAKYDEILATFTNFPDYIEVLAQVQPILNAYNAVLEYEGTSADEYEKLLDQFVTAVEDGKKEGSKVADLSNSLSSLADDFRTMALENFVPSEDTGTGEEVTPPGEDGTTPGEDGTEEEAAEPAPTATEDDPLAEIKGKIKKAFDDFMTETENKKGVSYELFNTLVDNLIAFLVTKK